MKSIQGLTVSNGEQINRSFEENSENLNNREMADVIAEDNASSDDLEPHERY